MRFSSISYLLACLLLFLPACRDGRNSVPEWEKALAELDNTLSRSEEIEQEKAARIDGLRTALSRAEDPVSRYRLCDGLFDEYIKSDLDSALAYAHLKEGFAAESEDAELRLDAALDLAQRYLISAMYYEALEVVNAADTASVRSGLSRSMNTHCTARGADRAMVSRRRSPSSDKRSSRRACRAPASFP